MASESKKRKANKKLHWGRGKHFMKWVGKGIKGLCYFTSSRRHQIVHGEKLELDMDDFVETFDIIMKIMEDYAAIIIKAAEEENYKKCV